MRIGDKVRMLHDRIDGIVVRILGNNQVEIEDQDGFTFPVLKSDLIIVNALENEYFPNANTTLDFKAKNQALKNNSIVGEENFNNFDKPKSGYLQLAIVSELQNYGVYIINGTKALSFVSTYFYDGVGYTFLAAEKLNSNAKIRVALLPLSKIENIKSILVLWHELSNSSSKPCFFEQVIAIKASKIMQAQEDIVELNTKGFIRPLSALAGDIKNADLSQILLQNNDLVEEKVVRQIVVPVKEIDLHAEALGIDSKLASADILRKQINVFREKIESAIVHNFDYIIFIHGVGDGVLKNEICKSLKDYPDVKYFEDAQKSKFGYGATKVVFK